MAYKKIYDSMSIVELITVCEAEGIEYKKGDEILDADAVRAELRKKKAKPEID